MSADQPVPFRVYQQAFRSCVITVGFDIKNNGDGTALPSWHADSPVKFISDPKTGKRYRVTCTLQVDSYKVDVHPSNLRSEK